MKKIFYVIIMISTMLLCACAKGSSEESLTPTGYPTGEIWQPQIMYDGQIYYYRDTGFDEPLPDGYVYAGTVVEVDNKHEPEQDFHGARLELEQEVYASEKDTESVYIEYKDGFAEFTVK